MKIKLIMLFILFGSAFGQINWLAGFAQDWLSDGDSIYDLDKNSLVDFIDFAFLSGNEPFVFTRDSVDVDDNNNIIPDDNYITKEFVLTSIPRWQEDTTAFSLKLLNYQETANYLWAVSTISPRSLYRKPKIGQEDWEQVGTFEQTNYVFTDQERRVIVMSGGQTPTGGYVSTDEGVNWIAITQMPVFNAGAFPMVAWNTVFNGDTVMMGEYKIEFPGYADRIFRSTDAGVTWERVLSVRVYFGYDDDDQSPTTTTLPYPGLVPFDLRQITPDGVERNLTHHCHAIGYHTGLGAWLASYGNAPNMMQFVSFDNGNTWHLLYGNDEARGDIYTDVELKTNNSQIGIQPIRLIDIGHPTKILCGGDTSKAIYLWDIPSGEITQLITDRLSIYHSNGGHFYCFNKSEGLFYAFDIAIRVYFSDAPSTPKMAKTLVSQDGINWTTYHQWSSPIFRQRYAGIAQNKIHVAQEYGLEKRWMLDVPVLAKYTGILIQSDASNMVTSKSLAQGSSDPISEWESHYTILDNYERAYSLTEGLFYEPNDTPGCLIWRTKDTIENRHWFRFNSVGDRIPLAHQGKNPYVRLWYSGYTGQGGELDEFEQAIIYAHNSNIPTTSASPPGIPLRITSRGPQWKEAIVPARVRPDEVFLRISFHVSSGGSIHRLRNDEKVRLLVDGVVISDAPVSFLFAQKNRNSTHLTYLSEVSAAWTSCFTVLPDTDYVSVSYPYEPWRNVYNYAANAYAVQKKGTGSGLLFKSKGANINDDPLAETPSGNWVQVTDPCELPCWHIKTWDFDQGNKLVLYLDTMPEYVNSNEVVGRYLRLAVYVDYELKETLSLNSRFVWNRRSQWNFAVSCDESLGVINWFTTHSELQSPEKHTTTNADITAAIVDGKFTHRSVLHHYGDTRTMKSYCFYLIYELNKELDMAFNDTEEVRAIMNDI